MPLQTSITRQLQIEHPIVQAPLAGGGDTPELVAAVSNAGGIGFIGAAYLTPAQILESARAVRNQTNRPFGINLFAPTPIPARPENSARAEQRLAPFFAELNLPAPRVAQITGNAFQEQLRAALQTDAAVFSFTFGILPADAISAVKARRMLLWGTATTVREAVALENLGVDAVVAQGSEAGGHRGTFLHDFGAGMVGTMALVPQVADAVRVPVIASGGIADGRGVAAALALGASGVQLGTSFLTCNESGASAAYKDAILTSKEDQTRVTRAFSGRPARGIVNRFMNEVDAEADELVLPFPWQNDLTRPLRKAAAQQGRAEFLSLWAGQALGLARRQTAGELVAILMRETERTLKRLGSATSSATRAA